MILVICIFFLPMVAFLPASDASTISEKQHGFFPLSSSTLCNTLFLYALFFFFQIHTLTKYHNLQGRQKKRQKVRREGGGRTPRWHSAVCFRHFWVCLSESKTDPHGEKRSLFCHGACSVTEATNAPSHLERSLQRVFCSCHRNLQPSAIYRRIFKFIFKGVPVLIAIQKKQPLGGTNPLQHPQCQVLFPVWSFIGVASAAPLLPCLPACFCHSSTSSWLSASSMTLITTCVPFSLSAPPNVAKPCRHSCGVRGWSVLKHACPLTCVAPDVPPCSR